MPTAKIDTNSMGDNTIVAAVSGKTIVVLSYVLFGGGTVSATWYSGSSSGGTALSGALSLLAGTLVNANGAAFTPQGWQGVLQCVKGDELNLDLSDNVQVSGHVSFVII